MISIQEARKIYPDIPYYTLEGLYQYVDNHIPTGGFLAAILSNDLFGAVNQADVNNSKALVSIIHFVYMEVPSISCGSKDKMLAWLTRT